MNNKHLFGSILLVLYCNLIAIILWFPVYLIIHFVMHLNWMGFILCMILVTPVIYGIVEFIRFVLCLPIIKIKYHWSAVIIGIIPLLLSLILSVWEIWGFDFDYTFLKIMLAITLTIEMVLIYFPLFNILIISCLESRDIKDTTVELENHKSYFVNDEIIYSSGCKAKIISKNDDETYSIIVSNEKGEGTIHTFELDTLEEIGFIPINKKQS